MKYLLLLFILFISYYFISKGSVHKIYGSVARDNEELRIGNMLNQFVVSIEISCLPKDLPHGIDVDVSGLGLGDHLTLTDLVLPEGVVITSLQHEDIEAHDQTVCSVTEPKLIIEEEEIEDTVDSELDEEGDAEGAEGSEGDEDSQDGDKEE